MITFAPCSLSSSAVARPMPRAEPVTIATLSSRTPMATDDSRWPSDRRAVRASLAGGEPNVGPWVGRQPRPGGECVRRGPRLQRRVRTHDVTDQPVAAPEPKAPSVPRPLAHAQILALQRTAGNQAVARHLARQPAPERGAAAGVLRAAEADRDQPRGPVHRHRGRRLLRGDDARGGRQGGGRGRARWASRFSNMGAIERLSLEAQHDPELVSGTVAAMKAAEVRFDAACKQFLGDFEARAGNAADELLTVSETTVKAEQERLGLKDSQYGHERQLGRAREAAPRRRAAAGQAPGGRRARADVRGRPDGVRARDPPRPVPRRPRRAREGRRGAQDLERGREGLRRAGPPRDRRPALAGDVHDRRRRGVQARRRQRRLARRPALPRLPPPARDRREAGQHRQGPRRARRPLQGAQAATRRADDQAGDGRRAVAGAARRRPHP